MRKYGQFCALAKALDQVGERWTLLIVRELSVRACRYTDLRAGLPGIPTNLLSERLKQLEANGIVVTEDAPPPIATRLYRLSAHGEGLIPVMAALGRWGAPQMVTPAPADEFRPHWIVVAARAVLEGIDLNGVDPIVATFEIEHVCITIRADNRRVSTELGDHSNPDLRIVCDGVTAMALITGQASFDDVQAAVTGNLAVRARFRRLTLAVGEP